jgi:hypothetical protein
MSREHERLGTLAEKLEFANALLKQLRRELEHERIEHGKTKALVHELEDRMRAELSSVAKEERIAARAQEMVRQAASASKKLRASLSACRESNKMLLRWMPGQTKLPNDNEQPTPREESQRDL